MSEQLYKSPWKGLFSYTEADKDSFFGRGEATELLYTLTHYNTLVTLYGKSGIGKTSLLQAGLFPIMREDGYTPVSVRFKEFLQEKGNHDTPLLIHLVKKISEACGIELPIPDDAHQESALWRFIYSTPFESEHHIKPLIVLDQFEETLITNRDAAELLLRQINALVDDTRIMPANFYADNTFKMVIAIREDDLFRLEDSIDRHALTLLKENRFRLGQLSDDDARCIILDGGKEIFDENNKERIANKIIERVKENDENRELSSAILSLMCDQLYKQYGTVGNRITLQQADKFGHNELEKFYIEATQEFTTEQRQAFEQRLITKNGRRKMANYEELNELLYGKIAHLIGGQTGILYQPDKKNVELIHDLLAKVIFESKQKREAEEAQRKAAAELKKARHRNRLVTGTLLIVAFVILSVFLIFNAFSPIIFDGPIENTTIDSHSPYKRYSVPSGTLHLYQNVMVEVGAFKGNPDIHTLIVGDSCYIDKWAFDYCPNLRHLILEGLVNDSTLRFHDYILSKVEEITLSENCSYDNYNISTFLNYNNIKKININSQNPNFRRLHNGTILTKTSEGDEYDWHLLFSPQETIYVSPDLGSIDCQGYHYHIIPLRELEIKNGIIPYGIDKNLIYKITSQDSVIEAIGFDRFKNLTEIDYPNAYSIDDYSFRNCKALSTTNIPNIHKIGDYAFKNCDAIITIDCIASRIGCGAFEGCDALKAVNLPYAFFIHDDAFRHCDALETINIHGVEFIGKNVFRHCVNLREVILRPTYLISSIGGDFIGKFTFFNCNNLKYVGDSKDSISINYIDRNFGPLNPIDSETLINYDSNDIDNTITYKTTQIYSFCPYFINPNGDYSKISLYVPYKQLSNYQYLRPYFKEVREMSIWQMLYVIAFKVYYPQCSALQFFIYLIGTGLCLVIFSATFIKMIRKKWKDITLYFAFILIALIIALLIKLISYLHDVYLPGRVLLALSLVIINFIYLLIYQNKYKKYIKRHRKSITITSVFFLCISIAFFIGIAASPRIETISIRILTSIIAYVTSLLLLFFSFYILALPIIHEIIESRKRRKLKKRLVKKIEM